MPRARENMSAQRLNAKNMRRIERATGLAVIRAWAHGGYVFDFVTPAPDHPDRHQHGVWHKTTGEWRLLTNPMHYSTCHEMFPPAH